MVNFPASLDALTTLTSSTKMNDSGYEGDTLINALNRIVEALEAKVGVGASTAVTGTVLAASGTGSTSYQSSVTLTGFLLPGAVSGTPAQHALYRENVVKGWCLFDSAGTIQAGYNVSSITDSGTGDWNVNWDRDFASGHCDVATARSDSTRFAQTTNSTTGVGLTRVFVKDNTGTAQDANSMSIIAMGTQ